MTLPVLPFIIISQLINRNIQMSIYQSQQKKRKYHGNRVDNQSRWFFLFVKWFTVYVAHTSRMGEPAVTTCVSNSLIGRPDRYDFTLTFARANSRGRHERSCKCNVQSRGRGIRQRRRSRASKSCLELIQ